MTWIKLTNMLSTSPSRPSLVFAYNVTNNEPKPVFTVSFPPQLAVLSNKRLHFSRGLCGVEDAPQRRRDQHREMSNVLHCSQVRTVRFHAKDALRSRVSWNCHTGDGCITRTNTWQSRPGWEKYKEDNEARTFFEGVATSDDQKPRVLAARWSFYYQSESSPVFCY